MSQQREGGLPAFESPVHQAVQDPRRQAPGLFAIFIVSLQQLLTEAWKWLLEYTLSLTEVVCSILSSGVELMTPCLMRPVLQLISWTSRRMLWFTWLLAVTRFATSFAEGALGMYLCSWGWILIITGNVLWTFTYKIAMIALKKLPILPISEPKESIMPSVQHSHFTAIIIMLDEAILCLPLILYVFSCLLLFATYQIVPSQDGSDNIGIRNTVVIFFILVAFGQTVKWLFEWRIQAKYGRRRQSV